MRSNRGLIDEEDCVYTLTTRLYQAAATSEYRAQAAAERGAGHVT
jgi:hypothetical protein